MPREYDGDAQTRQRSYTDEQRRKEELAFKIRDYKEGTRPLDEEIDFYVLSPQFSFFRHRGPLIK